MEKYMSKSLIVLALALSAYSGNAVANGLFEERPWQFPSTTNEGFYKLQREQLQQNERALEDNGLVGGASAAQTGAGSGSGSLGSATTIGNQNVFNDLRSITVDCGDNSTCSDNQQAGGENTATQSNQDSELNSTNNTEGNNVTDGGDIN